MTAMDDLTGQITKGYKLGERIGEGGFGAVYRAFQTSVGREVAIKVILPEYANHPDFIRRFETEAQLVARLEHPFIVPLFDYWRDSGGAYLVMRFFRGGSLKTKITEGGALELESASQLLDQIAGALAVAHRNNVIHRDIKPDNILLDDDGNAFLTDFGIAKVSRKGAEEEEEGISGSPGYISPEQITGSQVTPQTDIYSLGVLMYELVTGVHPFGGATVTELIFKQLSQSLPTLNMVRTDLPPSLDEVIQRATAKEPEERYSDVFELAKAFKKAVAINDETQEIAIVDEDYTVVFNPYKGLRPFEEADAADFFGRETLIRQLMDRLTEDDPFKRFLAVVGPSGSGKSSVVKAGLLPALRWGDIPNSESWYIAEMTPGTAPINELEAALLGVALNPPEDLYDRLRNDAAGLLNVVNQVIPEDSELLLVIDQFEEIFTLIDSEPLRTHFLAMIRTAISAPDSRVRIIITLRADFYDRPLLYEGFGSLMRQRTEVVLPLSTEELELTITGPANRAGLIVNSALLAAVVSDVREEPGALPLLQYVMTEVYERRDGRTLTLEAYQESGGALGALARRADELYNELDAPFQNITRQLFLRLVTLGEGTEDTRRRVQWSELTAVGIKSDDLQVVLDAFGKYRLLSFDRDPLTREPTVEVAHEALIREWKLLRAWLSESRDDVRMQRNLTAEAMEWTNSNNDMSFLLRGNRLAQFEEWAQQTDLALTQEERDFLQESIDMRETQRAIEEERRAREAELERVSRARLRVLVAVMSLAFVFALILSVYAFQQGQNAQDERDNAQTQSARAGTAAFNAQVQQEIAQNEAAIARSLALSASALQLQSDGNTQLALALALEANNIANPPERVQVALANIAYSFGMIDRLNGGENGHSAAVNSVAYDPDGGRILSGSDDTTMILWDADTGEVLRNFRGGHTLPIVTVEFSPDGRIAYSAALDRTLIAWDLETGDILQTLTSNSVINEMAINHQGTQALAGTSNGLILWDLTNGETLLTFGETAGSIQGVAFTPDGEAALSSTEDNNLILWDLTTGEVTRRFFGHTSDVLAVAVSPDGLSGLSISRDNSLIQWDLANGTILQRFSSSLFSVGGTAISLTIDFSPDGETFLTPSGNDLIEWDIATGEVIRVYRGHNLSVNGVAFSSDGRAFVSGSEGTVPILWSRGDGAVSLTLDTESASAEDIAHHPEDDRAAIALADNTVAIWDLAQNEIVQRLEGHTDVVNTVAFSPDGTLLATGADDDTVILWDVTTGEQLRTLTGHDRSILGVAFSPDGSQLVSGSEDATLMLWDIATGFALQTFTGHEGRVLSVAFSPNGETLLSGSADRTLILWDIASAQPIYVLEGHDRRVLSVAYDDDGDRLLSGSDDGFAILWDAASGNALRTFSANTETMVNPVSSVGFKPNDEVIATAFENGTFMLWSSESGQLIRQFTPLTASGIMEIQFSPDGETALTALNDGLVVEWLTPSLSGLIEWAYANRFVPELTCDERVEYSTAEQCDENGELINSR